MTGVVAFGLVVLAAALALWGLWLSQRGRGVQQRLESLLGSGSPVRGTEEADLNLEAAPSDLAKLLRPLAAPVAAAMPVAMRRSLRAKIGGAGLLPILGEGEFMVLRGLSALGGLGMSLLLYLLLASRSPLYGLLAAGLAVVIGAILPDYWVQSRMSQRQAGIRKTLPDALDLLVVSVEAGTGFDAAVARVQEKFPGPIGEEFSRVLYEMQLGRTRGNALLAMAERVNVPELTTFVSAIRQSEQLGVSVAQVLRVQSRTLRQTRMNKTREAAQKLPVKMLFPLVFFIFPALFIAIVGPGIVRIYETLLRQ